MRTPAIRPISMPHMPGGVDHHLARDRRRLDRACTVDARRPSTVIEVTLVFSQMRALRMRAPLAIAWVTLAGSM